MKIGKVKKSSLIETVSNVMKGLSVEAALNGWYRELVGLITNMLLVSHNLESESYAIKRVVDSVQQNIEDARAKLFENYLISSNDAYRCISGKDMIALKEVSVIDRLLKSGNIDRSVDPDAEHLLNSNQLQSQAEFKGMEICVNRKRFIKGNFPFSSTPDMAGFSGGTIDTVFEIKRHGQSSESNVYDVSIVESESKNFSNESLCQLAVHLVATDAPRGRCISIDNDAKTIKISTPITAESPSTVRFFANFYNVYLEICKRHMYGANRNASLPSSGELSLEEDLVAPVSKVSYLLGKRKRKHK
jgi:hypothetical protein